MARSRCCRCFLFSFIMSGLAGGLRLLRLTEPQAAGLLSRVARAPTTVTGLPRGRRARSELTGTVRLAEQLNMMTVAALARDLT